jgi:hypothetical protein
MNATIAEIQKQPEAAAPQIIPISGFNAPSFVVILANEAGAAGEPGPADDLILAAQHEVAMRGMGPAEGCWL